jgi:hypothetical protein
MTHLITGRNEYSRFTRAPGNYRFGRMVGTRSRMHAHRAMWRVRGFLKSLIEAVAASKLRRIKRELALRGINYDQGNNNWEARNPGGFPTREN